MSEAVPQVGDIVAGSLQLSKKLGAGAMGTVFAARQKELDRLVAIKFIQLGEPEWETAVKRLQDEARAASRIKHANLVEVYSAGNDEKLGPYIVYEYLRGGSLRQQIDDSGPLGWPGAYEELGAGLLSALAALHETGIIHRDVKPDNILKTQNGLFKLADLGLAKFSDRSAKTQAGVIIGTPGYIAPESASGNDLEAQPSYDIYGAAIVLIEAATGKLPFKESTALALIREQMTRSIKVRDLQDLGLSKSAATVLARAIAIDPKARPANIYEFIEELEATGARSCSDVTTQKVPAADVTKAAKKSYNKPVFWFLLFSFLLTFFIQQRMVRQQRVKKLSYSDLKQELLIEANAITKELAAYDSFDESFSREFNEAAKRLHTIACKLGKNKEFYEVISVAAGEREHLFNVIQAVLVEQGDNDLETVCGHWLGAYEGFTKESDDLASGRWILERLVTKLKKKKVNANKYDDLLLDTLHWSARLSKEKRLSEHSHALRCWVILEFALAAVKSHENPAQFEDMIPAIQLLFINPKLGDRASLAKKLSGIIDLYSTLPKRSKVKLVSESIDGLQKSAFLNSPFSREEFQKLLGKAMVDQQSTLARAQKSQAKEPWSPKKHGIVIPSYVPLYRRAYWLAFALSTLQPDSARAQLNCVETIEIVMDMRRLEVVEPSTAQKIKRWWGRGASRQFLVERSVLSLSELVAAIRNKGTVVDKERFTLEMGLIEGGHKWLNFFIVNTPLQIYKWQKVESSLQDEWPSKHALAAVSLGLSRSKNNKKIKDALKRARQRTLLLSRKLKNKKLAEEMLKRIDELL